MQGKVIVFLLLFICLISPAMAETALLNILKDGVGIRPLGMGGAFTAVADDASSCFYNPAGLTKFELGYLKGYQDINQTENKVNEYSMFVSQGFGFAFWQKEFASGERPEVFCYSYGKEGPNKVSWGLNYKIVRNSSLSVETLGNSFDVGLWGSFSKNVKWGVLFQDIIETIHVPASVRTGLAIRPFNNLLIASDIEFINLKSKDGADVYLMFGVENYITEGLTLRAGYKRNRWTGGITARLPYMVLEYALITSPPEDQEEVVQLFGFRLGPQPLN